MRHIADVVAATDNDDDDVVTSAEPPPPPSPPTPSPPPPTPAAGAFLARRRRLGACDLDERVINILTRGRDLPSATSHTTFYTQLLFNNFCLYLVSCERLRWSSALLSCSPSRHWWRHEGSSPKVHSAVQKSPPLQIKQAHSAKTRKCKTLTWFFHVQQWNVTFHESVTY